MKAYSTILDALQIKLFPSQGSEPFPTCLHEGWCTNLNATKFHFKSTETWHNMADSLGEESSQHLETFLQPFFFNYISEITYKKNYYFRNRIEDFRVFYTQAQIIEFHNFFFKQGVDIDTPI